MAIPKNNGCEAIPKTNKTIYFLKKNEKAKNSSKRTALMGNKGGHTSKRPKDPPKKELDETWKEFLIGWVSSRHPELGKEIDKGDIGGVRLVLQSYLGKIIVNQFEALEDAQKFKVHLSYSIEVMCYDKGATCHRLVLMVNESWKVEVLEDENLNKVFPDMEKLHHLFKTGTVLHEGAYGFDDGGLTVYT